MDLFDLLRYQSTPRYTYYPKHYHVPKRYAYPVKPQQYPFFLHPYDSDIEVEVEDIAPYGYPFFDGPRPQKKRVASNATSRTCDCDHCQALAAQRAAPKRRPSRLHKEQPWETREQKTSQTNNYKIKIQDGRTQKTSEVAEQTQEDAATTAEHPVPSIEVQPSTPEEQVAPASSTEPMQEKNDTLQIPEPSVSSSPQGSDSMEVEENGQEDPSEESELAEVPALIPQDDETTTEAESDASIERDNEQQQVEANLRKLQTLAEDITLMEITLEPEVFTTPLEFDESRRVKTVKQNKPYLEYEDKILKKMLELDGVDSLGSLVIRKRRKQLIAQCQHLLHKLDAYRARQLDRKL
ncbi:hypothetical protein BZG36_05174 [Bifiguratus adelaidae]|uniref:BAG domain-containing protein n=1 Tax=Bifiguratus adelaidae TaxID=1938954 RepID=A0A261XU22_9FUNG|nr:hypothetical protein BZG36_05174 [Bifiguratus adelaidae]